MVNDPVARARNAPLRIDGHNVHPTAVLQNQLNPSH
jgi:hypothetical protein